MEGRTNGRSNGVIDVSMKNSREKENKVEKEKR